MIVHQLGPTGLIDRPVKLAAKARVEHELGDLIRGRENKSLRLVQDEMRDEPFVANYFADALLDVLDSVVGCPIRTVRHPWSVAGKRSSRTSS